MSKTCRLLRKPGVQNAFDVVASTIHQPRDRMPFDSGNGGSECFDDVASTIHQSLGQPKWISGSEQHFGWIRGGAGGKLDRRVDLNRMSKMTPDINPKPNRNLKPRTDRVVWVK